MIFESQKHELKIVEKAEEMVSTAPSAQLYKLPTTEPMTSNMGMTY